MFVNRVEDRFETMKVVDIGAKTLDIDNAEAYFPWFSLARHPKVELIGFEPQDGERRKLLEKYAGQGATFLPDVVGDGSIKTFYESEYSDVCGCYPVPVLVEHLDVDSRPDINPLKKYKPAAWTIFRRPKERIF